MTEDIFPRSNFNNASMIIDFQGLLFKITSYDIKGSINNVDYNNTTKRKSIPAMIFGTSGTRLLTKQTCNIVHPVLGPLFTSVIATEF